MSKRIISDIPSPLHKEDRQFKGIMFLRNIPSSTRNHFHATCILDGKTMRDVMIQLMRKYVYARRKGERSIRIDDIRKLKKKDLWPN